MGRGGFLISAQAPQRLQAPLLGGTYISETPDPRIVSLSDQGQPHLQEGRGGLLVAAQAPQRLQAPLLSGELRRSALGLGPGRICDSCRSRRLPSTAPRVSQLLAAQRTASISNGIMASMRGRPGKARNYGVGFHQALTRLFWHRAQAARPARSRRGGARSARASAMDLGYRVSRTCSSSASCSAAVAAAPAAPRASAASAAAAAASPRPAARPPPPHPSPGARAPRPHAQPRPQRRPRPRRAGPGGPKLRLLRRQGRPVQGVREPSHLQPAGTTFPLLVQRPTAHVCKSRSCGVRRPRDYCAARCGVRMACRARVPTAIALPQAP